MKTYQYSEFTEKIQEKIFQDWYKIEAENFEMQDDYYIELLEENGFMSPKVYYRGFWSQGDGACFEIDNFCFKTFLEKTDYKLNDKEKNYVLDYCKGEIICINSHYSHSNTRKFQIQDENNCENYSEKMAEIINDLESEIESERKELSNKIYKLIESDYNYQTSKEKFLEYIKENEIVYNIFGEVQIKDDDITYFELKNLQCNYFKNQVQEFMNFSVGNLMNTEFYKHWIEFYKFISEYLQGDYKLEIENNWSREEKPINYKKYFNHLWTQSKQDKNIFEKKIIHDCNCILKMAKKELEKESKVSNG